MPVSVKEGQQKGRTQSEREEGGREKETERDRDK
jgi:hypothetical protein